MTSFYYIVRGCPNEVSLVGNKIVSVMYSETDAAKLAKEIGARSPGVPYTVLKAVAAYIHPEVRFP